MKMNHLKKYRTCHTAVVGTVALLGCLTARMAIAEEEQQEVVAVAGEPAAEPEPAEPAAPAASGPMHRQIIIRSVEPSGGGQATKEAAWLGVSVGEVSEGLAAQLGLKNGQGLVVQYIPLPRAMSRARHWLLGWPLFFRSSSGTWRITG